MLLLLGSISMRKGDCEPAIESLKRPQEAIPFGRDFSPSGHLACKLIFSEFFYMELIIFERYIGGILIDLSSRFSYSCPKPCMLRAILK